VALTKRGAIADWLLVVVTMAAAAAYLISDTSGAHLELAPLFVGAAVVVAALRLLRSRPGRHRA
jgi:hypothetical protein